MNEKGISLIVLIITIIMLIIISSTTIYVGTDAIGNARISQFKSELKIIQLKCDELLKSGWSQEDFQEKGKKVTEIENSTKYTKIVDTIIKTTGINNPESYIYYNKSGLENLGIAGIDREIVINLSEKIILDVNGIKDNNENMIYTTEWTGYSNLGSIMGDATIDFANTTRYGLIENNETTKSFEYTNKDMKLTCICQSGVHEKINIPIINLEKGKNYKLYFSQSNTVSATTSNNYGFTILTTQTTQTNSKIENLLWSQTTEPLIKKSINQVINFTATATTMYWTWDFSKLQDESEFEFKIYDVYIAQI